ncbi:hypothetical protein B0F90DRAFT_1667805 [Multifurca ochricompacta]|uniref:Fungal STAND N-terminal Goodbye domain-containing protein n=1 Tax=Multifurca ochricompacta TaxID=376703 RepID=A0AAD4M4C9_9AGAM|nr:hypothetical protein B0F90DRAFT_1667805 [Multifurca ochricompacta]
MSKSQPIATSNSHFQSIFDHALKAYKTQTKCDLIAHPLAVQFQSCHSPTAIIAILQNQIQEFDQSRGSDQKWNKWLSPTINVLYAFSATLGEGVFSPAKVIFAGIGVLLLAAKNVSGSQEALSNLFERVENFFKRLETYTEVPPTAAMTDIIVKIMVEVLGILALATKEIKQGSATSKLAHIVDNKVTSVDDKVKVVIEDGREAKVAAKEAKVIMQQTANTVDQVKRNQLRQIFEDGSLHLTHL